MACNFICLSSRYSKVPVSSEQKSNFIELTIFSVTSHDAVEIHAALKRYSDLTILISGPVRLSGQPCPS